MSAVSRSLQAACMSSTANSSTRSCAICRARSDKPLCRASSWLPKRGDTLYSMTPFGIFQILPRPLLLTLPLQMSSPMAHLSNMELNMRYSSASQHVLRTVHASQCSNSKLSVLITDVSRTLSTVCIASCCKAHWTSVLGAPLSFVSCFSQSLFAYICRQMGTAA